MPFEAICLRFIVAAQKSSIFPKPDVLVGYDEALLENPIAAGHELTAKATSIPSLTESAFVTTCNSKLRHPLRNQNRQQGSLQSCRHLVHAPKPSMHHPRQNLFMSFSNIHTSWKNGKHADAVHRKLVIIQMICRQKYSETSKSLNPKWENKIPLINKEKYERSKEQAERALICTFQASLLVIARYPQASLLPYEEAALLIVNSDTKRAASSY